MRSAKRGIGEVELDLGRYELRRCGRRVKLERKAMDLLIFLVGRREQMVSREDIVKKSGARTCLSTPTGTSTTLFERFAPLWVTIPQNRALLRLSWGKATDSSALCG